MSQFPRRQFLIVAGSLFLPVPYAWVWAQSEGTMKLLRLPKVALVVGNGKYKEAPLKNPANDARAIGDALKQVGFEVTLKLDATREEMAAAIQAYTQALAARKCVGLFYYAGHGVQLAWRNYMLPVDAVIERLDDVAKQAVEVGGLIEGITKAANPMNVIILDACRDNPFGNLKGLDHKGLSQMDAPTHTLLAYATSPGNVASDGDGANGLYTENLLRELKVPEAKVEDIFKRVRLGVRVTSKGAQIPWESTSLEEDFWFIPPKQLKAASDAEKEKVFVEQLALWEGIKASTDPAPLEHFLRRYPSGPLSELAQLQLDLALARQGEKRIEIASSSGNPFTQGFVRADIAYKIGDEYSYRVLDLESKAEKRTGTQRVSEVREAEVIFNTGLILDRLGNLVQVPDGRRYTPRQDLPLEFAVGRKWNSRFTVATQSGTSNLEFEFRIVRREKVTVPAGTFDCFVIKGDGSDWTSRGAWNDNRHTRWMAPDKVRQPVVQEVVRKHFPKRGPATVHQSERIELTSFKQS